MKIILFTIALFSTPVSAEIYKWTDAAGNIHFSDKIKTDRPVESVEVRINSYESVSYEPWQASESNSTDEDSKSVVMYATSWCGYCAKARRYFKSNNISFTEYDIENNTNAKRRYDSFGGKGVPIIFVGRTRMNGFSVTGFSRIFR